MPITLGQVITATRDRHPAFHRTRVTDALLARRLSDYQNTLIGKAVEREAQYLAQSAAIAVSLVGANAPGTVGAGTAGGLPADVVGSSIDVEQETAGGLLFPLRTVAEGGVVVVAERVATAATSTAISSTGAGRTTNQDALNIVVITAGKGRGQERAVISNTAAQWVISTGSDGKQWTTTPDTTSMFTIISPLIGGDETMGVVTALPAVSTRQGYLVRLSAQGAPYIDYTAPLTVSVDRGVPLPSMLAPLGGTVRYNDSSEDPLTVSTYGRRYDGTPTPAVFFRSGSMYLCGNNADWTDVVSIELPYVPIAPVFAALADLFLVPDGARSTLIAKAAHFAAVRVDGVEDIKLDVGEFKLEAVEAEAAYLSTLRLGKRVRSTTMRDGN